MKKANIKHKQKTQKPTAHKKSTTFTPFGKVWRASLCIAAPLCGGFIISLLTQNTMAKFGSFNQPPLAPPANTGSPSPFS